MKSTISTLGHPPRIIACIIACSLVFTACGGTGGGAQPDGSDTGPEETSPEETDAGGEVITLLTEPTGILYEIAEDMELYEGINVDVKAVGFNQVAANLLSGGGDLGVMTPIRTAEFVAEGDPFVYFSNAGGLRMINGVAVRTEDADKYQSVNDLVGETLAIPGFGTGTWATFNVFAQKVFGIEAPESAFEIVTADAGALLGLLESGEVAGSLLFSGQTAAAYTLEEFEVIFSFTETWQERTGQPLAIVGLTTTDEWFEQNPEAVRAINDALDAALKWLLEHPEEAQKGGKYEDLAEQAGWLSRPEATDGLFELMQSGDYFLTSDSYTQAWVDSIYDLIKMSEGIIIDSVPPKDEIYGPVDLNQ